MPATPPRNSRTLHRRTAVPTPNGCAASPPATSQAIALTAISGIVVALRTYETHTTTRRVPATSQVSART